MEHNSPDTEPGAAHDDPSTTARRTVNVNRRSLLRAGAAATPVLLTLASGPVGATTGTCTVASSFVSVATFNSRNPNGVAQCSTKTCESWKSECTNGNTHKAYMDSTSVTGLFGACSPTSSFSNSSLSSVMRHANGIEKTTELGVLQHLITLCMNVKTGNAGLPGNVTQTYIGNVWKNYKANGQRYLLPSSGIDWDSSEVVTWARMLVYPAP